MSFQNACRQFLGQFKFRGQLILPVKNRTFVQDPAALIVVAIAEEAGDLQLIILLKTGFPPELSALQRQVAVNQVRLLVRLPLFHLKTGDLHGDVACLAVHITKPSHINDAVQICAGLQR